MTKKSPKRPLRNEMDQASCLWGLICIFDFRHIRSNKKFLADRRRANKQALALKISVKELLQEEIFDEQGFTSQLNDSEKGLECIDSEKFSNPEQYCKVSIEMITEESANNSAGEILGWSSPNRDHFFIERFTNSPPDFKGCEQVENVYIEAKKHLSEILNGRDVNSESMSGQLPESLGRILSLPEYSCSKNQSCTEDIVISEGVLRIEETTESVPEGEGKIDSISCQSSSDTIGREISSPCSKDSYQDFRSDLFGDQMLSSPIMSPSRLKIKDSEPSPISVLEPLYTDEETSLSNTVCQTVEKEVQPRKIHFEEQSSDSDQTIEESEYEYVEALLLGSGLNWDAFTLRWLSSYEILDSSLFYEVELFSNRPHHDQKLLFDSANEVLNEVCEGHFGHFIGISRNVTKETDLILEVWEEIESHLFQNLFTDSLDQLVKREMTKCDKWMNIVSETISTGFEIEEIIFDELVEDIVMNFVDQSSNCEFRIV